MSGNYSLKVAGTPPSDVPLVSDLFPHLADLNGMWIADAANLTLVGGKVSQWSGIAQQGDVATQPTDVNRPTWDAVNKCVVGNLSPNSLLETNVFQDASAGYLLAVAENRASAAADNAYQKYFGRDRTFGQSTWVGRQISPGGARFGAVLGMLISVQSLTAWSDHSAQKYWWACTTQG